MITMILGAVTNIILDPIFRIFSNDLELITAGRPVLRVLVLIVPFIGVQMIGASYFQAVGKARPAFFLGLSRQFIFLLPMMIVLPLIFGLWGVFAAYPATDFLILRTAGSQRSHRR